MTNERIEKIRKEANNPMSLLYPHRMLIGELLEGIAQAKKDHQRDLLNIMASLKGG